MQISIEKRHLFLISAIIIFLAGVIIVVAVKPNPGHSLSEIEMPSPCATGQVLTKTAAGWGCSTVSPGGEITPYAIGNKIEDCSAAQEYFTSSTYTKIKEIVIPKGGNLNITFYISTTGSPSPTIYCTVYKNGAAEGAEVSYTGAGKTLEDDLTGWSALDKVQLYCRGNLCTSGCYVKDFCINVANPVDTYVTD